MKKLLFLSVLLTFFSFTYAQQAKIEFQEKEHNFGDIKEEDGKFTHTFEFTNTGTAPLVINGVSASCGCTTPDWTKEPVAPGAKGYVKATYNATGRPGAFKKSITVRNNSADQTVVLYISGKVIPRPKSVEEQYPVKMGDLRLKSNNTPLFDLYRGNSRTDRIEVKNISDKDVTVSFANVPKHVVVETNFTTLKPDAAGFIIITYNSKDIDDYGNRTDVIYMVQNGVENLSDEYKINVNSNLREDFSSLTAEERANAPVAEYQTKAVTIELKKGSKKSVTVSLKNAGKSSLNVRKIVYEKGLKASAPKSIAPDKTGQIKIEADGSNVADGQNLRVTVITNDVRQPVSMIAVTIKFVE